MSQKRKTGRLSLDEYLFPARARRTRVRGFLNLGMVFCVARAVGKNGL